MILTSRIIVFDSEVTNYHQLFKTKLKNWDNNDEMLSYMEFSRFIEYRFLIMYQSSIPTVFFIYINVFIEPRKIFNICYVYLLSLEFYVAIIQT